MNLIFGSTGQKPFDAEQLACAIGKPTSQITSAGHALFGWKDDDGVILGRAEADGRQLLMLGCLYRPLPEWPGEASPLDDANKAASYLLHRYERLGPEFLDQVTGQYAILLNDSVNENVFLASDPFGMRTWYLADFGQHQLFSTNMHALSQLCGRDLQIDRSQEDFFLMHGFYPYGGTPFRNVTSMPAGQLRRLEQGHASTRKIIYEDPWKGQERFSSAGIESLEVLTERLYDAFMTAVEEQSADDERAAVLLGGFDSALVASALRRLGKRVETFSFSYRESQFNQPHTDTLASFLGSKHHWITITQDIFAKGLRDFARGFNQPTNWPNYVIQTAHLCQVMRERGFHYCYSGDGCDTVFLGYPGTYRRAVLLEKIPTLPSWAVSLLELLFARELPERTFGHPYRVALNLMRSFGRPMPARGFVSFRIMDEVSLRQLRRDANPPQRQPVEQILRDLAEPHRGLPNLRLAYMGKSLVSPNKNKMVGGSDQSGLAILSPYLHPGLKHFASSLPESLCRPNEDTPSSVTGKYVLMKMAEDKGLLPKEVIYQPKVAGVDGPIDDWYAGPLNEMVMKLLEDLPFEANPDYLWRLSQPKFAEELFKNKVMVDNVVSHALSLLITYASFSALVQVADYRTKD